MAVPGVESTRADRWIWAVRLCKTRAEATEACRGRHVWVNDAVAKPATAVRVGDRVSATLHGRERRVEVRRIIDKRVGASIAAECLIDHSPPAAARDPAMLIRDPASGRPTKRDRRQLDRFRAR